MTNTQAICIALALLALSAVSGPALMYVVRGVG